MYKDFLNRYKTKEQIEVGVQKLKTIRSKDYQEIKSKYFEIFPIYPINAIKVDTKILESTLSVYRSRQVFDNIDPSKKKSFSYPENEDYTAIQRANWEGRNVFYASDSLYTSLSETKTLYNENEFFISKWGFNFNSSEIKHISLIPLGINRLPEDNPWRGVFNTDFLKEHLTKFLSTENSELLYHFYIQIGELFLTKHQEEYPITAFLADQILYHVNIKSDQSVLPILVYPSIENNFRSCNFAIPPSFVDKYLRLEKVFKIKISEVIKNRLLFNYNQIGIEKSDYEVQWYNFDYEREKGYYQFISISCKCGYQFDLRDIETLSLKKNGKNYHHAEIMPEITKDIDLIGNLENNIIIEEKEVLDGLMADFRSTVDELEIEVDGVTHKNITLEYKFRTPFIYTKI